MTLTLTELHDKIAERYDPDIVLELLDISTEELLFAFPEKVEKCRYKFDLCDEENYYEDNEQGEEA